VPRPDGEVAHAWYKFYAFIEPDLLLPDWDQVRIIEAIDAEGIPCRSGSCSEIYREKAFSGAGLAPPLPLPVAARLGRTSLMFLVHPTLSTRTWRRRSRSSPGSWARPRLMHPRSILALLHDVSAVAVAWLAAYWLRFNLDIPADYLAQAVTMLPWVLPVNLAIFWLAGLYRGIWRYSSLHDLKRILLSVAAAALLVVAGMYVAQKTAVPRSVLILYPMLLVGLMGGSRLLYRAWKERSLYGGMHPTQKPVLVIGAGDAAADLLRELARSTDWHVVGLLDDKPAKHGLQINGVRVLGAIDRVGQIATSLEVATRSLPCRARPRPPVGAQWNSPPRPASRVLTVPAFSDLLSGKFAISQVRAVELEDLLGRDRIELDEAGLHRLLAGKSVLVTGAGGSIGSELCRQIIRFGPRRLVFLEQSEFALYSIEQEFAGQPVSLRDGRRQGCRAHGGGVCRTPARRGVPRRRLQACAADGARQCLGGGEEQRAGHAQRRARRACLPAPASSC
jgi:hypothetical protein